MEPHISPGDVVLAAPLDPASAVPVGGVVEYRSPAQAEPSGIEKIRLHRIVDANTDGTFVTAGDANTVVDSTPITRDQITGQARLLVPSVGLPGLWLRSGNFGALALWSLITLAAGAVVIFGTKRPGTPPAGGGTPADHGTDDDGGEGADDGGNTSGDDDGDDSGDDTHDVEQVDEVAVDEAARETPPEHHPEYRTADSAPSPLRKSGAALGLVAALVAMTLLGATAFSSAAFTSTTRSSANTFGTAADWVPPSVTLVSPGPTVNGTTTLTAQASDAGSGIDNVMFQYAPASTGIWVDLCKPVSSPYSCVWSTTGVQDGSYLLRAIATDKAGLTTTTEPIGTTVANMFTVSLADPGETVRGTLNLATTLSNPGTVPYTVRVEYSLADANNWRPICQNLAAPYTCLWNTTALADNDYDLRSVAVTGTRTTYSPVITDVTVDNKGPSVTLKDPGVTIRGTTTFEATASDATSGVAQVQMQYLRSGTSTWVNMCVMEEEPYSCNFDTTTVVYGSYSFRAVATDEAGNSSVSAATSFRTVDNTVASVSVEDPGVYLTGTVTLRAAASSTAGITSVRIQTAPSGTTTWTTRCTLNTAPFTCAWNTAGVTDGAYDVRAVLLESTGKETISTTVANRRVDNSPLRAADIQALNGVGTPGRVDAGDTLVFNYSQQVNLSTVTPGWTGTGLPVTVRLRDGKLLGLGSNGDTIDIQRSGSTVNLGAVNTKSNFANNNKTSTWNGTMTATTATVNGIPRTVITVTVGSVTSGSSTLRSSNASVNMIWTPTATVKSITGATSSTTPATETGTLDRDF